MTDSRAFVLGFCAGALMLGAPAVFAAMRFAFVARSRAAQLHVYNVQDRTRSSLVHTLACAAHVSVVAVQARIVDLVHASVADLNGIVLFAARGAQLECVCTAGERFAGYAQARIAREGDSPAARASAARHRIRSHDSLAVPLLVDERQTGVLEVFAARQLRDEEADRVVMIAEQGALAWRVAFERERDRRRAERDALTGLLTPAELRRRLTRLVARMRAVRSARCSLLFIDTDRFKEWNDAYGHAAGDALLRAIGESLRRSAPLPDDLVARNGGDEFCIVLADTDKADGIARADLVRHAIASLNLASLRPSGCDDSLRVTASIGVAAYPSDGEAAEELLERADAAMYHSKRAGRDAVAFFDAAGTLAAIRAGASLDDSLS